MTADEFTSDMLGEIQRAFYPRTGTRFLQDREELLAAILLPIDYIHSQRDLVATGDLYRTIVRKVIATIRQHGRPDPRRRFSLYFLTCMQTHLQHHGEDYLKSAKALSVLTANGTRSLRQLEAIEITTSLEHALRSIRLKSGRKKAQAPKQPELFAS